MEHLKEARKFAEWSQKDRDARLPKLTDEQREQMQKYLQLVGQHGFSKTVSSADDCVNCPIVGNAKNALGFVSRTESSTSQSS
jgi:hypothetical protein